MVPMSIGQHQVAKLGMGNIVSRRFSQHNDTEQQLGVVAASRMRDHGVHFPRNLADRDGFDKPVLLTVFYDRARNY